MAANEPVSGIDVLIRSKADGRIVIQTVTDRRGTFVVKEFQPGLYSFEAGAKLPRALLKRAGACGISLVPAASKSVKPQSYRTRPTDKGMQVDIIVPPGAAISYTVIVTD